MRINSEVPFCEGRNCNKKASCKFHHVCGDDEIRQTIDYSMMASGHIDNATSSVEYWCGVNGDHKLYQPVVTSANIYNLMWNDMLNTVKDKINTSPECDVQKYLDMLNEMRRIELKYGRK